MVPVEPLIVLTGLRYAAIYFPFFLSSVLPCSLSYFFCPLLSVLFWFGGFSSIFLLLFRAGYWKDLSFLILGLVHPPNPPPRGSYLQPNISLHQVIPVSMGPIWPHTSRNNENIGEAGTLSADLRFDRMFSSGTSISYLYGDTYLYQLKFLTLL